MNQWHDQVWTLTGAHPVELRPAHRKAPLPILAVQRGHRLVTRLEGDQVRVDIHDSVGVPLGCLGVFAIQDDRSIQCTKVIDGVTCCLELTVTCFRRVGPMLTGIICPVGDPTGGDEGAIGGFSAEAQGGTDDGRS